ncbi:Vps5 C terminal like-domain-containing protein [Crepidotus variabilis]|uniref:Vps5 C terminal like-domain-containing protein n=1 Tax=Crepidotus variabilis TaxID=179855 RepID=A0A9P6JUX2_9AGAR|nr:Vps5 C terminal like-domain-containing protein [Crepidotus variabilis]
MFDPLGSSTAAFGGEEYEEAPPWPTTPHPPGSPIPNLRRASPAPPPPDKGPAPGIYGKEPQIYGQPEAGLVSPRDTGANGAKYEKAGPYLRVRINGLDRNRRDILVKFDAQTNLSNFNGTTYRNIARSYVEFQQFYESIVQSNPQTIIPALPLAQTSAPTDEEDDRLVKIMLQRWITRVCEDPILINDEDVRSFIESDFGYQPTPKPRRKTSSGFSLIRRGVPDEDEELQRARFELTKLEGQFFETAKAVDKLVLHRKALANVHSEMGNKLVNVATTEAHPPLGNALRKLGRTWHSLSDLEQAQGISECVILGDSLGYQGLNARSAKETLLMRTGVLEEYQTAVKTTISKRRHIERLKASSNIRPERVDEALEEIEEANRYEQILARRAENISQNLHRALQQHNKYANEDITMALIEHARSSIMYERQLLRELEALRADIQGADKKVIPSANGVPKPTIIPPLEDFDRRHPAPAPSAPISNGFHPPLPSQLQPPPHTAGIPSRNGSPSGFVPNRQPPAPSAHTIQSPTPSPFPQTPTFRQEPLSAASTQSFGPAGPLSPATPVAPTFQQRQPSLPAQSPGAGPSSPVPHSPVPKVAAEVPPLGGRFVDGTKSMFIQKSTSSPRPSPLATSASISNLQPSVPSGPLDPLRNASYSTVSSPIHDPLSSAQPPMRPQSVDPLGGLQPHQMTSSLRVQPSRPRLDAREAASKLANMF